MFDAEGLSRKKRVRAAHRGSVARFVNQAYEVLRAEDGLNVPKLKQQKHALSKKLDIIIIETGQQTDRLFARKNWRRRLNKRIRSG